MDTELTHLAICMTEDGKRIKVLPVGDISGRDKRAWKLDAAGAQALVDEVKKNNIDIVVDFEHGSYAGDGKAAGWLPAATFAVEPDGIYAEINWTDEGRESVQAREYRYLSPAFLSDGGKILSLESVGLVNVPNLTLPALNRKAKKPAVPDVSGNNPAAPDLTALQLELQATRRKVAEMELNARVREIADIVDTAVKAGKLSPAQVQVCTRIGLADKGSLEELIRTSPANLNVLTQGAKKPAGAGAPHIGKREELIQKNMKETQCSYRDAMLMVARSNPELFESES